MKTSHSIAIIGGGPTGLMFGCLCALRGWDFVLLDKRVSHSTHSRSIGIHPPSLRLFEQIGLRPALLDQGTRIETGVAHIERERCGTIDFTRIAHGPPYILTLAQSITESLLEKRLRELAPDSLVRGQAVKEMVKNNNRYHLKTERGVTISVDWVVGCDGRHSLVRNNSGIAHRAHRYPDHYCMGDFADHMGNRNEALVYLCRDGLVESFPHSANLRRWVLHTGDRPLATEDPYTLAEQIGRRIGRQPDAQSCTMFSQFQPEFFMADTFATGRLLLAGDAAHTVSPIGGQGMNLGWLDGAAAVQAIHEETNLAIRRYANTRKKFACRAARRAEFNMAMGRPFTSLRRTKLVTYCMLNTPIKHLMSRRFTMHGLS